VLLSFSPREGRLVNQWAADHTHAMAGAVPLLALDMYEHAYHIDFGANAGAYVDAFMGLIDWAKVYERYQHAVHAASEGLAADAQRLDGARLVDVRRAGVFEKAETLIAGAHWRDPAAVDAWAHELGEGAGDVVLYCVYGHEVCRATALRLRSQGIAARFLPGGIDAWQAAGRPTIAKEQSS
jgi:Fe-Mn family superoxide dismutase